MSTVKVFTDAPSAYDYSPMTMELDPRAGTLSNGKFLRLVEIKESISVGQILRYGSGNHVAYVNGDFQLHESLRFRNLTLKPEYLLREQEAGWDGEYAPGS